MKVDKMSVSFEAELGDAIRGAASRRGRTLSSWLAEAAASKLRSEALVEYLDAWELEHGALSTDELAAAERKLGLPSASTRSVA